MEALSIDKSITVNSGKITISFGTNIVYNLKFQKLKNIFFNSLKFIFINFRGELRRGELSYGGNCPGGGDCPGGIVQGGNVQGGIVLDPWHYNVSCVFNYYLFNEFTQIY